MRDRRYASLTHIPPKLDASMVVRGVFATSRIPDLDAAKIASGVLAVARIPDLDANKITSGTFALARIPTMDWAHMPFTTWAGLITQVGTTVGYPLHVSALYINDTSVIDGSRNLTNIASITTANSTSTFFKIPFSIPVGITVEGGGTTPLINLDANFRFSDKNTTYRGGAIRIDTRGGTYKLFQFLKRPAGSTTETEIMSLSEDGVLTVPSLTVNSTLTIPNLTVSGTSTVKDLVVTGALPNVDYAGYYIQPIPINGQISSITSTTSPWRWYANNGSSTFGIVGGMVELTTGTVYDNYFGVAYQSNPMNPPTWDKNFVFSVCFYVNSTSSITAYIGRGTYAVSNTTTRHVGFKLSEASLYGTVANGSTESTVYLGTINPATYVVLKVVYTAGTGGSVRFYINGTYYNQITTNLPSGASDANDFPAIYVHNYSSSAVSKSVRSNEARLNQLP